MRRCLAFICLIGWSGLFWQAGQCYPSAEMLFWQGYRGHPLPDVCKYTSIMHRRRNVILTNRMITVKTNSTPHHLIKYARYLPSLFYPGARNVHLFLNSFTIGIVKCSTVGILFQRSMAGSMEVWHCLQQEYQFSNWGTEQGICFCRHTGSEADRQMDRQIQMTIQPRQVRPWGKICVKHMKHPQSTKEGRPSL